MVLNVYTGAGLVVGLALGFFGGRRWAEYFRAEDESRRQYEQRKRYRGRSTTAFIVGGLLIIAVLLLFGFGTTTP